MQFLILILSAFWWTTATGTPVTTIADTPAGCEVSLTDSAPDFAPDLKLHAELAMVTYRGQTFGLTRAEFLILHLIVNAPSEVISRDDLIRGIWGSDVPRLPDSASKVMISKIRNRFREVDPGFDRLIAKYNVGYYWRRDQPALITKGRVAVAKHVYEGYADGRTIKLSASEYAILVALMEGDLVSARTIDASVQTAFPVMVCRLNQKFEAVLGVRLTTSGPYGSRAVRLNKALSTVPVTPNE